MIRDSQMTFRQLTESLSIRSAEFLKNSLQMSPNLSAWTKLYAASQALLLAVGEKRVVPALVEICSNFLGCEQMAIVKFDHWTGEINVLKADGLTDPALASSTINAIVPIWTEEESSAAIFLFQPPPQHSELDGEARQIVELLSSYAGHCLRSESCDWC